MFDGEVSKRRAFAKATLQTRAEAEGLSAILRDDACEGLECHTEEVRPALYIYQVHTSKYIVVFLSLIHI